MHVPCSLKSVTGKLQFAYNMHNSKHPLQSIAERYGTKFTLLVQKIMLLGHFVVESWTACHS